MTGESRTPSDGRQPADGRYTALLDRFEETEDDRELAVLLLESGDEVVAERAIPSWRLPEDARQQDAVLELSVRNGFVTSMAYDSAATERRVESAQSRFDRLAERPEESDEGE
ncbi:DUF3006 domain-containing protein [Halorussus ruber]|uniref:DUF3006 domain-containing protein n=1 Tax=Halorussus ruber TaxID=1126238 RepID=UPI0010920544|nr:DUF3006 domain-containing protein [Halorussus ruber]